MLEQAPIPKEMKEMLQNELPNLMEHIDEASAKIFDPSKVWLESIQFADYVSQLAQHLLDEECGCRPEERQLITAQLVHVAETFKEVAEASMQVLDHSDKILEGVIKDGTHK